MATYAQRDFHRKSPLAEMHCSRCSRSGELTSSCRLKSEYEVIDEVSHGLNTWTVILY